MFLTTDHPNGGSFLAYPKLIRLLMDRSYRNDALAAINPAAAALSTLGSLKREYTLEEIAIMTRAAPARILGLTQHGRLTPGAVADVVLYEPQSDVEQMFAAPRYVFKSGELVAEHGRIVAEPRGNVHVLRPQFDRGIEAVLGDYFDRFHSMRLASFAIDRDELLELSGAPRRIEQALRPR